MVYVWLAITVIALIVEVVTADMLSIWFAGGGLLAMVSALFDAQLIVQICIFIVVSVVLLLVFRKVVLKKLSSGKEGNLNADAVIGKEFELITAVGFNTPGTIKVNDVVWNVVCEEQSKIIPEKTIVKVVGLKGNKYIVKEI